MKNVKDLFTKFELKDYETLGEGGIIGDLSLIRNARVLVWGAGPRGRVAIKYIQNQGAKIDFVIDISEEKRNQYLCDVKIILPDEMDKELLESEEYIVVVATDYYLFPYDQNLIHNICAKYNVIGVFDIFRPEYNGNYHLPYSINDINYYFEHQSEVIEVGNMFEDELSFENYYEYLRVRMSGDTWRIGEGKVRDKYWGEGLYTHKEDEYWVNCGSAIGDSIFHFIGKHKNFAHIDAYEADLNIVKRLKRNLLFLPEEMRNKIKICGEFLGDENSEINFDNRYKNTPISLIDMDIEGAEEAVIRGSKEILNNQRPVLAICVYHKASDIIRIPQIIKKYNPDYRLFLRKYATCSWNRGNSSELVLYGIPSNRLA